MNNKLSELSKPVAWFLGTKECKNLTTSEEYANWYVEKMSTASPLYSQEYVSALEQRAESLDAMLTESVQALEAAELRANLSDAERGAYVMTIRARDKRIAELEQHSNKEQWLA